MVDISIVQGRLSSKVGDKFQHFPIHAWREEFDIAADLGLDGIEWIISDFSNPIFDKFVLDELKKICHKSNVKVTSVSLDLLMYDPIFCCTWENIVWLFDRLCFAIDRLNIRRVTIPIEENSGISSPENAKTIVSVLQKIMIKYQNNIPLICIETDLSPLNAQWLLSNPDLERLGLLLDIGNVKANGFLLNDYFTYCKDCIYAYHVKDRSIGYGASCPVGQGEADIKNALSFHKYLPNLADITLQTFRSSDNYIEDTVKALKFVKDLLSDIDRNGYEV